MSLKVNGSELHSTRGTGVFNVSVIKIQPSCGFIIFNLFGFSRETKYKTSLFVNSLIKVLIHLANKGWGSRSGFPNFYEKTGNFKKKKKKKKKMEEKA